MNSALSILVCVYAYIKFIFGYNTYKCDHKKGLILRVIFVVLTLLTCLLMACLLLPFFVYYNIVDLYLRINLGTAYGGILTRQDAFMHAIRDKTVIQGVIILNENKKDGDILKSFLEKAENLYLSSFKLSSTIRRCLGYYYYHKNQVQFEDVVEQRKIGDTEYITKEALIDYVNGLPHPPVEHRLWSLSFFPQPILWNNKSNSTRQYAIMISFQHTISDGPNNFRYLIKYLMDDSYKPPQSNSLLNLKSLPKFSIDDAYIFQNQAQNIFSRHEFPKLNNNQSQQQYLAVYSEEEEIYLNLIKRVKTKLNVGFTSVVVGALLSSVTDYLRKTGRTLVDITFLTTIRPEEINLVFKSRDDDPLMNDVGTQIVKIPASQTTSSILENIMAINKYLKQIRRSVDSTMVYLLNNLYILPSIAQSMIFNSATGVSVIATNMSGVNSLRLAGHDVEAAYFYVSHTEDLSFIFCIMSLDGRLQITLRSSDNYVSSREELQTILHKILGNIDEVAKELDIA